MPASADSSRPTTAALATLPDLAPIQALRAHEQVAAELRRNIALGYVGPGEQFPSERELASTFRVGRATVQAAIRLLEAEGLVESVRGRRGGTFVLRQHGDELAIEHLLVDLRRSRPRVRQVLVFRGTIEPAAAALAAEQREADGLERLIDAARREERAERDTDVQRWDNAFHLAVAATTGNRFFYDDVERVRLELEDTLAVLPATPGDRDATHRQHSAIVRNITNGRPTAARRAMQAHVDATSARILAMFDEI